jgi:hypothetical protein
MLKLIARHSALEVKAGIGSRSLSAVWKRLQDYLSVQADIEADITKHTRPDIGRVPDAYQTQYHLDRW